MNLVRLSHGTTINLDQIQHAEFVPAHTADPGDGDFHNYKDTLKLGNANGCFWNPDGLEAPRLRDLLERHCVPPIVPIESAEPVRETLAAMIGEMALPVKTMNLHFVKAGNVYVNLSHVTSILFGPSRLERMPSEPKDGKKGRGGKKKKKGKKDKKRKGEMRLIPCYLSLFKADHTSWEVWGDQALELRTYLDEHFTLLREVPKTGIRRYLDEAGRRSCQDWRRRAGGCTGNLF